MNLKPLMFLGVAVGIAIGIMFMESPIVEAKGQAADLYCGMKPVPPMGYKKLDAYCMCPSKPSFKTCKWIWIKR